MAGNKKAYALFQKNKLVGCYFSKSKAVHLVDEHLGNGLFAPKWDGNKKGEYEIVPCEAAYDKIFIVPRANNQPRIFASIEEITEMFKNRGIKVIKKKIRTKTFEIVTERGLVKGEMVQVK